MQLSAGLTKRFLIRLLIGGLPLYFFAAAMLSKGQSGNSGMSPNMEKFLAVILLFGWTGFLIIEALYLFGKKKISQGWSSICTAAILALLFFLILYLERTL